jgi:hypothetical protein
MTPAQAIAALDRQLVAHGEDVTLRTGNTTVGQITVRAFVRGTSVKPLAGSVTQADMKVSISPTGLGAFQPTQDGFVVVKGKPCKIEGKPELLWLDGELVRINIMVRG